MNDEEKESMNHSETSEKSNEQSIKNSASKLIEQTKKNVGSFAISIAKVFSGTGNAHDWIVVLSFFLPIIIGIVLLFFVIFATVISALEDSMNSFEYIWYENAKEEKDTSNLTAFEQQMYEKGENGDLREIVVSNDETINDYNQKYNQAILQAYVQYKDGTKSSIWSQIKAFFTNLFTSPLNSSIPTLSSSETYGVEIDPLLVSSALYGNRFFADAIMQDKQEAFLKSLENTIENTVYYKLHTKEFRDEIEKQYFELANKDVDELEAAQLAKVAIDGIQILSKYMILRTETYYTLNDDLVGTTYDTTKHIAIKHMNPMSDSSCLKYVVGIGSAEVEYKRGVRGKYSWKNPSNEEEAEIISNCSSTYNLSNYDDAKGAGGLGEYAGDYGMDMDVTYTRRCDDFKNYLLGTYPTEEDLGIFGGEETYELGFIKTYYHNMIPDPEDEESVEKAVNDIYILYESHQQRTGIMGPCTLSSINNGDLSCGIDSIGAAGTCEYDNYSVYVYDGDKKTVAGPISMGEYLTRVSYAEIGHIFSGGSNKDEIIKANMVIAKTYMLYHLNKGTNGARVDNESKSVYVLGEGSGGFQAFYKFNIPNLEHYVSLYSSISNYVLLSTDGGIFNANYAECSKNNVNKGVQNILYAFDSRYGGSKGHSSAALSDLKASGMNYQNATFTQILNYIISVGATNYNCSIDNYYSNAVLGTCNQTSSGPGYISGGGSSDLPSLDIPSASNSLEFYTQSTSSIGVSSAKIYFEGTGKGVSVSPTDVYCAPASLAMIINRFGNFMYLNSIFYGVPAPSYNGVAIDSLFCKSHGKPERNCEKMMTVVKLGKYLIEIGKESPTSGALGAVSDSSWLSDFGVKQVARVTNPSKANIANYLSQGYVIIGHVKRHYIVIYGYDSATGTIYYHDPASQSGNNLSTTTLEFGYKESRKSTLYEYYVFGAA